MATHNKNPLPKNRPLSRVHTSYDLLRVHHIESPSVVLPPQPRLIDVVVLDMYMGRQNLGHDSVVLAIREMLEEVRPAMETVGLGVRVLSFDVREKLALPAHKPGRFQIYIGTGGGGNPDPHQNDGQAVGCQGIDENPSWEPLLWDLFDTIEADPSAALFGLCHSFGIMCRWRRAAFPRYRGVKGMSHGVVTNYLTPEAAAHPWFQHLYQASKAGKIKVMDHRLFDLIPDLQVIGQRKGVQVMAYESGPRGPGEAVTMVEFARTPDGAMPRILAMNGHPEVVNQERQMRLIQEKWQSGRVTRSWYDDRIRIIRSYAQGPEGPGPVNLAAQWSFLLPLKFYLFRQIRQVLQAAGVITSVSEHSVTDEAIAGLSSAA